MGGERNTYNLETFINVRIKSYHPGQIHVLSPLMSLSPCEVCVLGVCLCSTNWSNYHSSSLLLRMEVRKPLFHLLFHLLTLSSIIIFCSSRNPEPCSSPNSWSGMLRQVRIQVLSWNMAKYLNFLYPKFVKLYVCRGFKLIGGARVTRRGHFKPYFLEWPRSEVAGSGKSIKHRPRTGSKQGRERLPRTKQPSGWEASDVTDPGRPHRILAWVLRPNRTICRSYHELGDFRSHTAVRLSSQHLKW